MFHLISQNAAVQMTTNDVAVLHSQIICFAEIMCFVSFQLHERHERWLLPAAAADPAAAAESAETAAAAAAAPTAEDGGGGGPPVRLRPLCAFDRRPVLTSFWFRPVAGRPVRNGRVFGPHLTVLTLSTLPAGRVQPKLSAGRVCVCDVLPGARYI